MIRTPIRFAFPLFLAVATACGDDSPGRYTQSAVTVSINAENHVAVDITYTNTGEDDFNGSRCIELEWQTGTPPSQAEVRANKSSSSPSATVVDFVHWCLGGNNSLENGKSDAFHLTSAKLASELKGTTIVVYADEYKITAEDDRTMRASP